MTDYATFLDAEMQPIELPFRELEDDAPSVWVVTGHEYRHHDILAVCLYLHGERGVSGWIREHIEREERRHRSVYHLDGGGLGAHFDKIEVTEHQLEGAEDG